MNSLNELLNPLAFTPALGYLPVSPFQAGLAAGRCAAGLPAAGPGLGQLPVGNNMALFQMVELLSLMLVSNELRQQLGQPDQQQSESTGSTPDVSGGSSSSGTNDSSGAAGAGLPGGHIGKGTKVLMIGDSHTVGGFGTELDKDLRASGASVDTYAASGSSASSWLNGGSTSSGWVNRKPDGSVDQPPWNSPHGIPKLADLIAKDHPDVVVINLGANFRGESPAGIQKQAQGLAEVARKAGTRIIWVGPPKSQKDGSGGSLEQFDNQMKQALSGYGEYISSNQFTPHYAGSDGLHYSGTEGSQIAKSWADGIARILTGG